MTGSYFDSSAIVKLVLTEPGSAELDAYVQQERVLVTSKLSVIEVERAVKTIMHGVDEIARREVDRELGKFALIAIDDPVIARARDLAGSSLRSLDAIHLATALEGDVDEFVSYDRRQLAAAASQGLLTASPGAA